MQVFEDVGLDFADEVGALPGLLSPVRRGDAEVLVLLIVVVRDQRALLQLLAAVGVYIWATMVADGGLTASHTASVVSLSGGALFANVVSVVLLVVETVSYRRH